MTEQLIPLDLIDDNPFQDRGVYEDIPGLGRTIAINGLEQKPKARFDGKRYQLKFGHRRKRAFEWLRDNFKQEGLQSGYNDYKVMPLVVEEISDQEMFDGVVIENVHRDDLKVTEKARLLRRYKELNSEKTSEQIGLIFNMNAATVRGMDIFLDLPEPVQAKLDDGTISQGTARSLHSMQKIAPAAKILETLKAIEKEKGNTLPEEVIEEAIDHLENVEGLWSEGHRDGKPRAGYHGWPLDMKNLPSKLLPELTLEQAEKCCGVKTTTHQDTNVYKNLVETIRSGKDLDDHFFGAEVNAKVQHLLNPPACSACPFYTKVRGSHYCGMKICYARKEIAWAAFSVEVASKNTKIAIYTEQDGAYRPIGYSSEQLFEKRHKDLRLVPKRMINGYCYQHFKGLDDDLVVVVAVGETLNKLGASSLSSARGGGKKTEKEKADMRALKLYRAKRKEFLWDFTACAKSMFDGVPGSVLNRLANWQYTGVDQRPPVDPPSESNKEAWAEYMRRFLVWKLIIEKSSDFSREKITTILSNLEKYTQSWKVKVPTSLKKMAEQFDGEIHAAASVSTETGKGKK